MPKRYNNISDEAIRSATSRTWEEWIQLLDREGCEALSHKDIASLLVERGHISANDTWWAQTVTVGYEYAKGRRVKGQTKDAGFQVGVQKTIEVETDRLWAFLVNPPGLALWLGSDSLPLSKGATYESKDGTRGEVRSVYPGEKLRLTWQPRSWDEPTTLQLYLMDKGDRTALRFHHEKLADAEQRAKMKSHWRGILEQIQTAL